MDKLLADIWEFTVLLKRPRKSQQTQTEHKLASSRITYFGDMIMNAVALVICWSLERDVLVGTLLAVKS